MTAHDSSLPSLELAGEITEFHDDSDADSDSGLEEVMGLQL